MKKIRLLVVALLCLTIGGVYATWTFADDNSVDRKGQTVTIILAGKTETSEVLGSLAIELSDDFSITIDQTDAGNHTAKLVIVGDITLRFTANTNASETIRENGIEAQYYFAATDIKFNDDSDNVDAPVSVYNIDTTPKLIKPENDTGTDAKWTEESDRVFTYTISNAELQELIKINTFVIDTSTEYASFNEVLRSGTVTLYLNDTATPTA